MRTRRVRIRADSITPGMDTSPVAILPFLRCCVLPWTEPADAWNDRRSCWATDKGLIREIGGRQCIGAALCGSAVPLVPWRARRCAGTEAHGSPWRLGTTFAAALIPLDLDSLQIAWPCAGKEVHIAASDCQVRAQHVLV